MGTQEPFKEKKMSISYPIKIHSVTAIQSQSLDITPLYYKMFEIVYTERYAKKRRDYAILSLSLADEYVGLNNDYQYDQLTVHASGRRDLKLSYKDVLPALKASDVYADALEGVNIAVVIRNNPEYCKLLRQE